MRPHRFPAQLAWITSGCAALVLFAFWAERENIWPWHLTRSRDMTSALGNQKDPATEASSRADAFDRVIIHNIGAVPFVEIFDLLRSAPPEKRLQWIRQLEEMPAGPQRAAALASFYKTFVQLDPHAAVASISGLKNDGTLYIAVDAMIGAAPISAMPEMAEMLAGLPAKIDWGRPSFFGDVIDHWSMVDPEAAAKFFDSHPKISFELSAGLLRNWAQLDARAAKEWLEAQPESKQTDYVIDSFVSGWFERDEAGASAYAAAHSREEKFGNAINFIAETLFLRSPEQARAFLVGLPNEEARNTAARDIASITNGIILGGSDDWSRPPADVAGWLISLPHAAWQGAIGTVLENWQRQDEVGMTRWLDQLPPETRDQAVSEYCSTWSRENQPEHTIAWAMTITDPTLREQSLRELVSHWLSGSRKQALIKLETSTLPKAQKEYLATLLPEE